MPMPLTSAPAATPRGRRKRLAMECLGRVRVRVKGSRLG